MPTRQAVADDPALFATGSPPVLVDEFQHVPHFLDAVKAELNKEVTPGRFVLTGSTRYLTVPAVAQSLTGRVHVSTLWPLSQGELGGTRETFVDRFLAEPDTLLALSDRPGPATTRGEYVSRVLAGGFPLAVARRQVERATGGSVTM
jgi:predicted AAA+ superfamily ATPase